MNNFQATQVSPAAARDSQVVAQVCRLESALDDIDQGLMALCNRLQGVTREQPAETAVPMPPEEVLVPLAAKVREMYKRATSLRDGINGLRDRLEV